MRSNSGLERFQRSSLSHNNLSATRFRVDIGINPLKRPGSAGQPATPPSPMTGNSSEDGSTISIEKTAHQKRPPIYERVEDNAFHLHICELSCDVERAKLYSVSAPIFE